MTDEAAAAEPAPKVADIDSHLHEKNAALGEWLAANPEPHTPEQKADKLSLCQRLFGEFDGIVTELKAELGIDTAKTEEPKEAT